MPNATKEMSKVSSNGSTRVNTKAMAATKAMATRDRSKKNTTMWTSLTKIHSFKKPPKTLINLHLATCIKTLLIKPKTTKKRKKATAPRAAHSESMVTRMTTKKT